MRRSETDHVVLSPPILHLRSGRRAYEEIKTKLCRGVILEVILFHMIRERSWTLRNEASSSISLVNEQGKARRTHVIFGYL